MYAVQRLNNETTTNCLQFPRKHRIFWNSRAQGG